MRVSNVLDVLHEREREGEIIDVCKRLSPIDAWWLLRSLGQMGFRDRWISYSDGSIIFYPFIFAIKYKIDTILKK